MSDDTGPAVEIDPDDTITIVLSDGHEMVRAGLLLLLQRVSGLAVVADVPDAVAAARALAIHRPRVLVLDLGLPGGAHLAAVGDLRQADQETAVVVLALHCDPALTRGERSAPDELSRRELEVLRLSPTAIPTPRSLPSCI